MYMLQGVGTGTGLYMYMLQVMPQELIALNRFPRTFWYMYMY